MIVIHSEGENGRAKVEAIYGAEMSTLTTAHTIPTDTLPKASGKDTALFVDTVTGYLFYDYVDAPLTPVELALQALLKTENDKALQALEAIASLYEELLLGGLV